MSNYDASGDFSGLLEGSNGNFFLGKFRKKDFPITFFGECLDIILHNIQVVHDNITVYIVLITLMINPGSNERSFESFLG